MSLESRDDVERVQLERLNGERSGLALLRSNNTFYRQKLEGLRLPLASIDDFRSLPFTTKDDLVQDQEHHPPFGTNLTYPSSTYVRIHSTSGTTGRRLKWLDTRSSWGWVVDCWQEIYRKIGVGPEDRIFAAFGFGPFLGFWAGFEAAEQVGALAISGGAQSTLQRLDWLLDSQATVLLSTPTYALRLAEVARDNDIDLASSPIRTTIHAGEPGASSPTTRARIESAWGARCWDHAGLTEVGAWGYECPQGGGMHLIETEFIGEVLDLDTGAPVADLEMGELVLSNLGRWAMPNLRYRTGDLVRFESSPCSCGSPFVRFPGGVLGRVDDMVQVRGVNLYPSAVETLVREHTEVVEFEVEVFQEREMWEMTLRVELVPGADDSVGEAIVQSLQTGLGIRTSVDIVPAGSLPRYELKAKRFQLRKPSD